MQIDRPTTASVSPGLCLLSLSECWSPGSSGRQADPQDHRDGNNLRSGGEDDRVSHQGEGPGWVSLSPPPTRSPRDSFSETSSPLTRQLERFPDLDVLSLEPETMMPWVLRPSTAFLSLSLSVPHSELCGAGLFSVQRENCRRGKKLCTLCLCMKLMSSTHGHRDFWLCSQVCFPSISPAVVCVSLR